MREDCTKYNECRLPTQCCNSKCIEYTNKETGVWQDSLGRRKTKWQEGVEAEIEASHIRMSSNDDVEYALEVIDTLLDKLFSLEFRHPKDCVCMYCD